MAVRPRRGTWVFTPEAAARALAWNGPADPGTGSR